MIEAHGLIKRFGEKRALNGMTFSVPEGRIYGLLGPNGAGKTTTMRILACLLNPDGGSAWVAGVDAARNPEKVRSTIGILTEVPGLYDRLKAGEYLDFFAQMYGLQGSQRRARIEGLMRLLDIWDARNERLRSFSKGMKQKVAIARALIHRPQVLLFDEPTAALDPEAAKTVRDHIVDLIRTERCTVLLCTHNLAEAEQLCWRISIVQQGRSIAEGTPIELKAMAAQAVRLSLRAVLPNYVAVVHATPGVEALATENGTITYRTTDAASVNPRVVRQLVEAGADVLSLQLEAMGLEDAYLHVMRKGESDPNTPRDPT
ncbi:MAG TPA: ABC transporter ATP-binding protein [Chloroflexota bacterium]|nr:ABC transporter ATP-binding protein [Chloroflexota bacterium]